MPTIDWAFLCDYAYVDQAGKISILGVFENLFAQSLPTDHSQLFVALQAKLAPGDSFNLGAIISSPSGKEITKTTDQLVKHPNNNQGLVKCLFCLGFYMIKIEEEGQYNIEIFMNGNSIHVIPFTVSLIKKIA